MSMVAVAAGLSLNGAFRLGEGALLLEAQARAGRPLTPMDAYGRVTTRC